jgi:hypothetical protein
LAAKSSGSSIALNLSRLVVVFIYFYLGHELPVLDTVRLLPPLLPVLRVLGRDAVNKDFNNITVNNA